jgi:NADH-quinone oxidoreductase subunit C
VDLQLRSEELVRSRFPDEVVDVGSHAHQRWIEVKRGRILEILRTLRDELDFDMLTDLTAVDWLNQGKPERFQVVYQLFSLKRLMQEPEGGREYYRVKAWVPEDDPTIDSVKALWKAVPFAEREVYDMYGIRFHGYAEGELKRILLPDNYPGFPLRKDYPLTGTDRTRPSGPAAPGERYDFPKLTR